MEDKMCTYILLYRCKDETEYHNTCVSENIFQIQKHILLCGFQDDYDRLKLEIWKDGDFMMEIEGNNISKFINNK
jgi:hypothetical protein